MKKYVCIMIVVLTLTIFGGCGYRGNVGNSPGISPYGTQDYNTPNNTARHDLVTNNGNNYGIGSLVTENPAYGVTTPGANAR